MSSLFYINSLCIYFVIVISAGIFEEDRQRILKEGADEVHFNPVKLASLAADIQRLLDTRTCS
jgi:DNA-binding response OmpR family regulator